jgi:hypothetical protein
VSWRSADLGVELLEVVLELAQERRHQATHGIGGRLAPALFGHDHRDDLAAAGHEIGQETVGSLQDRPNRRASLLAEEREESGVDGVGLGQHAHSLTEASDTARVDHDHRKPCFGELGDEPALVAARGLHHDALRG